MLSLGWHCYSAKVGFGLLGRGEGRGKICLGCHYECFCWTEESVVLGERHSFGLSWTGVEGMLLPLLILEWAVWRSEEDRGSRGLRGRYLPQVPIDLVISVYL